MSLSICGRFCPLVLGNILLSVMSSESVLCLKMCSIHLSLQHCCIVCKFVKFCVIILGGCSENVTDNFGAYNARYVTFGRDRLGAHCLGTWTFRRWDVWAPDVSALCCFLLSRWYNVVSRGNSWWKIMGLVGRWVLYFNLIYTVPTLRAWHLGTNPKAFR